MCRVTIKQLIEKLGYYDPNMTVYIQGKEGGLEDLSLENVVVSGVYRDVSSEKHEGFGAHEDVNAIRSNSYEGEKGNEILYAEEFGLIFCRGS